MNSQSSYSMSSQTSASHANELSQSTIIKDTDSLSSTKRFNKPDWSPQSKSFNEESNAIAYKSKSLFEQNRIENKNVENASLSANDLNDGEMALEQQQKQSTNSSADWLTMLFNQLHHNNNDHHSNKHFPIHNNDIQNPKQLLAHLVPSLDISKLPSNVSDFEVCRLIYQLIASTPDENEAVPAAANAVGDSMNCPSIPPSILSSLFLVQRDKLDHVNTIEHCIELIYNAKSIIVLTGAGCSVSCGIPDFRSRDGIYARLRVDFPDLPDPQAMFDIFYFEHDPRPFFKFAKEIYPGQFRPSLSHMFIKKLEEHGKLLRNYTQNIDTLELTAGIQNVIQCHGKLTA
jgi:hypothetical protein